MWRALCVSAAVGVGFSTVNLATDRHLFAGNNLQDESKNLLKAGQTEEDFEHAVVLFEEGDAEEALKYLHKNEGKFTYENPQGKKWVDLAVDVNTALYSNVHLAALYRHFPEAFKSREKASLLVAGYLIQQREAKAYSKLRQSWKGSENLHTEWLFLDVDALLLNHQRSEAIDLLNAHKLTGELETNRLVRLALLTIQKDPKAAWDYLSEAQAKDPENMDIYAYKARLLESVDKNNLALAEYMTALEAAPKNIFMKDLLADFYLRHGRHQQAIALWKEAQEGSALDTLWLKAYFWSRMTTPSQENLSEMNPPLGKLHAFNQYLLELPQSKFWDQKRFEKLPSAKQLLLTQQATLWLRLLEDLKSGREESALKLLRENPFTKNSWDPALERALKQLLVYRLTGNVDTSDSDLTVYAHKKNENAFFAFLDSLPDQPALLSQEKGLRTLLTGREAFIVAFLSAGWFEAGLQLYDQSILSGDLPSWTAVAIAEAMNTNRGYEEALQFAMLQPSSPQLSALMADLLKLAKNSNSFVYTLKKTAAQQSEKGMKAAWLLSLIYIERGNYEAAKQSIYAQPLLAEIFLGKEALARIALLEGDTELANQLYLEIESQSIEAKSYLARNAFIEKNWGRAHALTLQLLDVYPDNPVLEENLRKIAQAAKLPGTSINVR